VRTGPNGIAWKGRCPGCHRPGEGICYQCAVQRPRMLTPETVREYAAVHGVQVTITTAETPARQIGATDE
jgi:hypothetical protein